MPSTRVISPDPPDIGLDDHGSSLAQPTKHRSKLALSTSVATFLLTFAWLSAGAVSKTFLDICLPWEGQKT